MKKPSKRKLAPKFYGRKMNTYTNENEIGNLHGNTNENEITWIIALKRFFGDSIVKTQEMFGQILPTLLSIFKKFSTSVKNLDPRNIVMSMSSIFTNYFKEIKDALQSMTTYLFESSLKFFEMFELFITFSDFVTELTKPFIVLKDGNFVSSFGIGFLTRLSMFAHRLYLFFRKYFTFGLVQAEPQSGESTYTHFLLSSIFVSVLPPYFRTLLQGATTVTNQKLFDSTSILYDLFQLLIDIPRTIVNYILPKSLSTTLNIIFEKLELLIPISKYGKIIRDAKEIVLEWKKDNRLLHNNIFQDRFRPILDNFRNYIDLLIQTRRELPPYVFNVKRDLDKMAIKLRYIQTTTRVEPVWVVFLGPPGTGKTSCMNLMVKHYQAVNTVYVHNTPSNSKNFYDQYDDEDIYIMDDVGQKGVEQWSDYINMVSTTKYPLDCASAELKDTKFFNSKLIMSTTNSINLTLTPSCGISDLGALYRRMHLFDFSEVKFVDGKFFGKIVLKRYNIFNKHWSLVKEFIVDDSLRSQNKLFQDIHDYLHLQLATNLQIFNTNFSSNSSSSEVVFQAIPQDGVKEQVINTIHKGITYFMQVDFLQFIFDEFVNLIEYLLSLISSAIVHSKTGVVSLYDGLTTSLMNISRNEIELVFLFSSIGAWIGLSYFFIMNKIAKLHAPDKELNLVKNAYYRSDSSKPLTYIEALPQSLEKVFSLQGDADIQGLAKFKSNMFGVKFDYVNLAGEQVTSSFISLFSSQYFLTPYHASLAKANTPVFATVFSSTKNIIYDKVQVTLVWYHQHDDIAIYKLPPLLPTYARKIKIVVDSNVNPLYLVLPNKLKTLEGHLTHENFRVQYMKYTYVNQLHPEEFLTHDTFLDSLCGALCVTAQGAIIGHHIAGIDSLQKGVIKIFSYETITHIMRIFDNKEQMFVPIKREEDIESNAAILDISLFSPPNSRSTFVESEVSGIFPKERSPAQFSDKPFKRIKELSKASLLETQIPSITAFPFVEQVVDQMLQDWNPVLWSDEKVLIHGDGITNRIDPTTSVGFGLPGNKKDYIDYDNNKLSEQLKDLMTEFELNIKMDKYPEFFFVEQLKDELRDIEKVDKPRIFRASPLVHNVLGRKYLGSLQSYFSEPYNRFKTGVMIGINPFSNEWSRLLQNVIRFGDNCFDGDFSKFDKKMLSTFQQLITTRIIVRMKNSNQFTEDQLRTSEFLLKSLMMNPVICVDTVMMTTHSLPSGACLTAQFNSLIHKAYLAYSFFILYKEKFLIEPTLYYYNTNVYSAVYGDDGLTGVSDLVKDWFNGPSMRDVLRTIGLDYTPGDKNDWDYKTRSIYKCTFLKRSFYFHKILNAIVAPLQLRSVCSTLNYVKDATRNSELTLIKLYNFQREIFLHDTYDDLLALAEQYLKNIEYNISWLPRQALVDMYNRDEYIDYLPLH